MVARNPPSRLAIIGQPVAQSLSPVFQGAALAACGLPQTYERWPVEASGLDALLERCIRDRVGGNVTMPHKEVMLTRCALLSSAAHRAGAVNTFWVDDAQLCGHNTDIDGVMATLQALRPGGIDQPVIVLGAGGSARAVMVALELLGCPRVYLVARTAAKGEQLGAHFRLETSIVEPTALERSGALEHASVIINATPMGMSDHTHPIDLSRIPSHMALFDLVYRAGGTAWIREGRARGLRAEDGLRMLVEQGAAAFTCWFDRPAPRESMWQALGVPMPPAGAPRD